MTFILKIIQLRIIMSDEKQILLDWNQNSRIRKTQQKMHSHFY